MSSSDNDDRDSDSLATDAAVAVIVAPNPAQGTIETPANLAPDVARPPSNIAELNPVPNAITPSPAAIKSVLVEFGFLYPARRAGPSMNNSRILPSARCDKWPRTLGLQRTRRIGTSFCFVS